MWKAVYLCVVSSIGTVSVYLCLQAQSAAFPFVSFMSDHQQYNWFRRELFVFIVAFQSIIIGS